MATLSDVAARAGVSVSAVSRVLSKSPSSRVSDATRRRIEDAARELDYRPNFAARALKLSRTNVIALVVPDVTNAIFSELMRGIDERAQELGYMVLLARAESMQHQAESLAHLVGQSKVDGVIVQLGDSMTTAYLTALVQSQIPALVVNSRRLGGVGSVTLPDEAGAAAAVQHLASLGHRRIGLVGGLASTDSAQRRATGFAGAMADAGLPVPAEYLTGFGYESAQGRAALSQLATLVEPPSAIVVANINAAFGVLLEAHAHGIRVPEDLSIVALHDAWTADNTWPPLTTVRMPLYELGKASMAAMFERIHSGVITDVVITDPAPELVLRESTSVYRRVFN
ncbi:MAG: LacI family DNA-binding transcriptional regulator [Lacisediminihabitans sp.]